MEKVNKDCHFKLAFLNTKEAAKYLRLHKLTLTRLVKNGEVPGIKIGGRWKFHKETLENWLAKGDLS